MIKELGFRMIIIDLYRGRSWHWLKFTQYHSSNDWFVTILWMGIWLCRVQDDTPDSWYDYNGIFLCRVHCAVHLCTKKEDFLFCSKLLIQVKMLPVKFWISKKVARTLATNFLRAASLKSFNVSSKKLSDAQDIMKICF